MRASRERRARRRLVRGHLDPAVGHGPEPSHASARHDRRRDRPAHGRRHPGVDDPGALHRFRRRPRARSPPTRWPRRPVCGVRRRHGDPDLDAQRRHVRHGLRHLSLRHERQRVRRSSRRPRPGRRPPRPTVPGAGTWYYVVRTTVGSWDSVDSNQASAVVTATSTTFKACVTTAADTTGAGDNNGYQSNPTRACTSDNSYAQDTDSGTEHDVVLRDRSGAVDDQGPPSVLRLRLRPAGHGDRHRRHPGPGRSQARCVHGHERACAPSSRGTAARPGRRSRPRRSRPRRRRPTSSAARPTRGAVPGRSSELEHDATSGSASSMPRRSRPATSSSTTWRSASPTRRRRDGSSVPASAGARSRMTSRSPSASASSSS